MKKNLKLVGIGLILAALGYGVGRYVQPAEIKTKEVEVIKKDVKTVVRTVKLPDGTITRERTTEDKTSTSNEKSTESKARAAWKINMMAGYNYNRLPEYHLMVQKNILGPLSVGAYGGTSSVGLTVGYEF